MARKLYLDICDYSKKPLYPLFDSDVKVPGEAANIIVATERNGWRELSFTLPTVCHTEQGDEDNAALQYLKSDYLIRFRDDYETDWFIISEPKITHNGFMKTISVTAGHVSQLLKVKNLGLEFSDNDGNNIGTARQLAETILEGTGWTVGYVYDFREKRTNEIKVRSLKAQAKTGAFKLMTTMCDLFEAKPVYHGDDKTVDIIPINPFSSYEPGSMPDLTLANGVIELHYGRNVKNVTRAMNSENIVTRLYAYGSYGNKIDGYCAIDECTHKEYRFTLDEGLDQGNEYYFTVPDDSGVNITYSFVADNTAAAESVLVYSIMDPASMLYIWNETSGKAYPVQKQSSDTDTDLLINHCGDHDYEEIESRNWFSFIMDFDYYRQNGMLSDEMIQYLALYQRRAVLKYEETRDAANEFTAKQTELARIIGSVDMCKLAITNITTGTDQDQGYIKLTLDTNNYTNGVIYRSDYDKTKQKQFKWRCASQLDSEGDPIDSSCVMYIIKTTEVVTQEPTLDYEYKRAYLRRVDDEDNPTEITLWLSLDEFRELNDNLTVIFPGNYQFFLISTDTNGYLGSLESKDEAAVNADNTTTFITEEHPIIYTDQNPQNVGIEDVNRFGWLWKYNYTINEHTGAIQSAPSDLYFCYRPENSEDQDDSWKYVHYTDDISQESFSNGQYWYDWRKGILSKYKNGRWVQMIENKGGTLAGHYNYETGEIVAEGTTDEEKIGSTFGAVHLRGMQRDRYWQGTSERIVYTVPAQTQENPTQGTLRKGNYAFVDGYSNYLVFSTKSSLFVGDTLTYHYTAEDPTINGYVIQKVDNIETTIENVKTYPFDAVYTHPDNILDGLEFQDGMLRDDGNADDTRGGVRLRGFAPVVPNTVYQLRDFANGANSYFGYITVLFYTSSKTFIADTAIKPTAALPQFTAPKNAHYIRISIFKPNNQQVGDSLDDFQNYIQHPVICAIYKDNIIIDDISYRILDSDNVVYDGENIGIITMIRKFVTIADDVYANAYASMVQRQNDIKQLENTMIEAMGDLFREGYWQDDSYVDGDETKLYDDAMDKLEKIAFPETTYTIGFIDLYDSNGNDLDYGSDPDTISVSWPDISISSAAHLVDEEIGINTWGFIDKIQKCYDKPWTTTISINTNLTTIAQHSFADVMTNIANVTNTVKANVTKYDRTASNAVTYQQYDDLLANLVTLTKVTERNGGKIQTMQNAITNHESNIIQAANLIATEVSRALNEEEQLRSRIEQTESGITSTVTREVTNAIVESGLDAFSASIICPQGAFITEDVTELTLNAAVYRGISQENLVDRVVTQDNPYSIPSTALKWHKRRYTDQGQELWDLIDEDVSSITVTAQQIGDQSMFRLSANIDGHNRYAYFTAADISKVSQLELYLTTNMPAVQTLSYGSGNTYAPDWSNPLNPLTITPQLYFNGTLVGNEDVTSYVWEKQVNNGNMITIQNASDEIMHATKDRQYGILTVGQNTNTGTITYRCTATYQNNSIRAEKTFTLLQTEFSTESCNITGVQVFKYENNVPVYSSINLTASTRGCDVVNWWYRDETKSGDAAWTPYPGLTDEERTSTTLTVNDTDPIFYSDAATIKVTTTFIDKTDGPYDIFKIYKIYHNEGEANAPLVYVTNSNIQFIADQNGIVPKDTERTLYIVSYLGTQKVVPTCTGVASDNNDIAITYANSNADSEVPVTITVTEDSNLGNVDVTSGVLLLYVGYPINTTLRVDWNKLISCTQGVFLAGAQGISVKEMRTYYTKSPRESSPNADEYLVGTLDDEQVLAIFGGTDVNEDGVVNAEDAVGDPVLGSMVLGAKSVWSRAVPNIDEVERYLWAYDVIEYTDGSDPVYTKPRVAGVYGDIGSKPLSYGMYTPLGEVFNQNTEKLTTTVYIFSGTEDIASICSYDWDYYYGGVWNQIYRNGTYSYDWDLTWLRSHCSGGATMRCTIKCNGEQYYAYCNVIDKTDNYQALIYSSAGSTFHDGVGTTTLRCRLYQNGQEVDTDGMMFSYTWTRLDKNGVQVEEEFATGKSIIVSAIEDVQDTKTFVCYAASLNGDYSTQGQFTLNCSMNIVYSDDPPENPSTNMLWVDTSSDDVNILKRWDGTKFVDINISQQQIADINQQLTQQQTQIEQLADRISLTVTETEATRNDFNGFIENTYSSDLTLTSKQIEMSVTKIEQIPDYSELKTLNRTVKSWMKFDENGLELGKNVYDDGVENKEESKFRTRLSPTRLSFLEDQTEVAYMSNRSLFISDARIVNQFNIGSNLSDANGGWYRYRMKTGGLSIEWAAEHFVKYKFYGKVAYNNNPNGKTFGNCFAFLIRRTEEDFTVTTSSKKRYQETVQNDSDGDIYFSSITFDAPGTYYYIVSQIENGIYGDPTDPIMRVGTVTYDKQQYYLMVEIVNASEDPELSAQGKTGLELKFAGCKTSIDPDMDFTSFTAVDTQSQNPLIYFQNDFAMT